MAANQIVTIEFPTLAINVVALVYMHGSRSDPDLLLAVEQTNTRFQLSFMDLVSDYHLYMIQICEYVCVSFNLFGAH